MAEHEAKRLIIEPLAPSSHGIAANPAKAQVSRVIDEWLLIEYGVTFLPMNETALVEVVSKSDVTSERLQPRAGFNCMRPPQVATLG